MVEKLTFQKGPDIITVEVLEDGSIKMETNKVSMPNHLNADNLILEIIKLAGGESKRQRKAGAVLHQHDGHFHTH